MPDPPCPGRPQVPEEPKVFVGKVEIHNTIRVPFGEEDPAASRDDAIEIAASIVRELLSQPIADSVDGDIDIDIHESEAFRDGE